MTCPNSNTLSDANATCQNGIVLQVGRAPLHVAAQTGNLDSLVRLLDAGAHRAPRDRVSLAPSEGAFTKGAWFRVVVFKSVHEFASCRCGRRLVEL